MLKPLRIKCRHCDYLFISGEKQFSVQNKRIIIIRNNNVNSICYKFPRLQFLNLFFASRKETNGTLLSVKKNGNKIIASYLIKLCRGNGAKVLIRVL